MKRAYRLTVDVLTLAQKRCSPPLLRQEATVARVAAGRPMHTSTSPRQVQPRTSVTSSPVVGRWVHSLPDGESPNWEEWFAKEEYDDPWDASSLQPLEDSALDLQSRHLLHLLHDLYHIGHRRPGMDRISSERCDAFIRHLMKNESSERTTTDSEDYDCVANRADRILKSMELFLPLAERARSRGIKIPLPTYDTYTMTLLLYARLPAGQSKEIPLRCEEIVNKMIELSDGGEIFLEQPRIMEWNQVLLAWADCADAEKAVHAAKFLMKLKEHKVQPDKSSYGHVLRACAHHREDKLAKRLGPSVAVKVWNGMLKGELGANNFEMTTSHIFVFFIKAVGTMERGDTSDSKTKDGYIKDAFEHCCRLGLVDEHVLQELQRASSPELYKRILKDQHKIRRWHAGNLVKLPTEWRRNSASSSKNVASATA